MQTVEWWKRERLTRWQRFRAWLRESTWVGVVARVTLVAAGIVFLSWVGRFATASTGPPPLVPPDAGGIPMTTLAPPPSPPSPPSPAAPAAPAALADAGAPHVPSSRATADDPVYVNLAGAEDLRRLPGVGDKRAEAILALRARIGRFQRVEDLMKVKGIGRAMIRKWRPLVRVDRPATTPSAG